MKNCTSCGAPLEDGYTFCPHCGASCSHGAGGEGEKKCPKCGAPVRGGYTFCISCGASLHAGSAEEARLASPRPAVPPQPAPYAPPRQYYGAGRPVNTAGIAGFVVGIAALFLLLWIVMNIVLSFIGLVVSGVGMSLRRAHRLSGFAIAGLVVNIVALLLAVLVTFAVFSRI